MTLSIRAIDSSFAAEVAGIDLRLPLSAADVAAIEAGMDRHAVLVFHGQPVSDDQQMAFTRNFGGIEHAAGGNITRSDCTRAAPWASAVSARPSARCSVRCASAWCAPIR